MKNGILYLIDNRITELHRARCLLKTIPELKPATPLKDPIAVAMGRRGGLKGGPARARKLTPQQRIEIARKAANARWQRGGEIKK